jgi:hypothetical protein
VILAAGLLVLLGLGLFIGGVVTATTVFYWACVAACALAAVLLVVAWLRTGREAGEFDRRVSEAPTEATPATGTRPEAPRTAPQPVEIPEPADAAPGPDAAVDPEPASAPPQPVAEEPADEEPADEEPAAEGPVAGEPAAEEPVAEGPVAEGPVAEGPTALVPPAGDGDPEEQAPSRRGAHEPRESPADATAGEPGEEDVLVTDLLLVVDLDDEVLVVDEHPRYHLAGCRFLDGRTTVPLPMVEARTDGFTPCGACRPVRHLADTERSRRAAARGT